MSEKSLNKMAPYHLRLRRYKNNSNSSEKQSAKTNMADCSVNLLDFRKDLSDLEKEQSTNHKKLLKPMTHVKKFEDSSNNNEMALSELKGWLSSSVAFPQDMCTSVKSNFQKQAQLFGKQMSLHENKHTQNCANVLSKPLSNCLTKKTLCTRSSSVNCSANVLKNVDINRSREKRKCSVKTERSLQKVVCSPFLSPIVTLRNMSSESSSDTSTPVTNYNSQHEIDESLFGFEQLLKPVKNFPLDHCGISPIVDSDLKSIKKSLATSSSLTQRVKMTKVITAKKTKNSNIKKFEKNKPTPDISLFSLSAEPIEFKPKENKSNDEVEPEKSSKRRVYSRPKKNKDYVLKPFQEPHIPWNDILDHKLVIE